MSYPKLTASLRLPFLLLGIAFLAACAQKGAIEEPRELESFDSRYKVDTLWTHRARGRAERLFLGLRPATDGEKVYVAGHGGRLSALDSERGRRVWSVDLDVELSAGPAVGEGYVLVGSLDGDLYALDAEDGSRRWTQQTGGELLSAPAVTRGYVVVKTADGHVRGLALDDGAQVWQRSEEPPGLKMRGSTVPVIRGSRVVAGFENGRVRAFSVRDGQAQWSEAVGVPAGRNELEEIADIAPIMAVGSSELYAASADGRVAALTLSGSKRWQRDLGSLSGVAMDEERVFITDQHSEVHALDRSGGASIWLQDAMRARQMTAPVVYRDTVVVGDLDGYLHFMDIETGELVARDRISRKRISMPPVVIGDALVVQDSNGRVRALRLRRN